MNRVYHYQDANDVTIKCGSNIGNDMTLNTVNRSIKLLFYYWQNLNEHLYQQVWIIIINNDKKLHWVKQRTSEKIGGGQLNQIIVETVSVKLPEALNTHKCVTLCRHHQKKAQHTTLVEDVAEHTQECGPLEVPPK